jgi:hypothetical protein
MAVLAGCGSSNPGQAASSIGADQSPQSTPQLHVHANGLQLSVPETYQVGTTLVGFVIEPTGNNHRRNPITISIQLLATPPETKGHRVRYLGSQRVLWYTATRDEEGGSSGVEWTVVAFEQVGNHWIQYRENKLSESEPEELWGIAMGLRYLPPS